MKKPNVLDTTLQTERLITGMYSFDRAFNAKSFPLGVPLGKGWEIIAPAHTGKSTLATSLAGILNKHMGGNILLADIEGNEPFHIGNNLDHQGYDGIVYTLDEETDEEMLTAIPLYLKDEELDVTSVILDSIGAISPVAEREGTVGEANIGRRAFLMAQFSRKCLPFVRIKYKKNIFMINHHYPRVVYPGMVTPGGQVKDFLSSVRITLKQVYKFKQGSYAIQGTVIKNRCGGIDQETVGGKKVSHSIFFLGINSGTGIHHGLTAMWDCRELGIARNVKGWIKIGDETIGRLSDITLNALTFDFTPFYEALKENENEKTLSKEN